MGSSQHRTWESPEPVPGGAGDSARPAGFSGPAARPHHPEVPSSADSSGAPAPSGPAVAAARAPLTAQWLRHLLTEEGPYRRRWRSEVRRASARDPHQSAVAQVLAHYLWEIGEAPDADLDLPRRLKDLVARAMRGSGISHQTLGWFIGAFKMGAADEQELWERLQSDLAGGEEIGTAFAVLPGERSRPQPGATRPLPADDQLRAGYRTQSLIERFEVSADRGRKRHTLMHVLRARVPLTHVTYRFDTPDVDVQVLRGGTVGDLVPGTDGPSGLFTLDIALTTPLRPGDMTVLETVATYPPGGPVQSDFLRGLRATAGGVSLAVTFDQAAAPRHVRWTHLTHGPAPSGGPVPADAGPITQPVSLSPDGSVHRFLTPAHDCTVGFEWDW